MLLLAAWFCFYNLGARSVSRADESLYVRSVQEMLHTASWIPTIQKAPFLHKPPLTQFFMRASVGIWGDVTWAYRVPSAIAGFIVLLLVPTFAYRLWGSYLISACSFVSILSCKVLFSSHLIREAVPDGLLILFISIGQIVGWELWRALSAPRVEMRKVQRLSILLGLSLLFALLAKSVAGLVGIIVWWIFIAIASGSALLPTWRRTLAHIFQGASYVRSEQCEEACHPWTFSLFGRVLLFSSLLPILLFAGIYGAILYAVPGKLGAALHSEVVEKLVGEGHHNTDLPLYYISQLFVRERTFPALAIIVAIFFGVREAIRGDRRFLYLCTSIILPVCGFSVLHSRLYWYLAPIFMPTAIVIGATLARCLSWAVDNGRQTLARLRAAVIAMALFIVLFAHILAVVHSQLLTPQPAMRLEVAIRELSEEVTGANRVAPAVIRLCIDPDDEHFKSLMLREWFYLDVLKPFAISGCDPAVISLLDESVTDIAIITTPKYEGKIPKRVVVINREEIRLDRWKTISHPNRAKSIVFIRGQLRAALE